MLRLLGWSNHRSGRNGPLAHEETCREGLQDLIVLVAGDTPQLDQTTRSLAELLERRLYSEHPPRYEYVPTERTRDFRAVLLALLAWGNRHFAPEGASVLVIDRKTGLRADPVLVDGISGKPLDDPRFSLAAGPAAREGVRRRYAQPLPNGQQS